MMTFSIAIPVYNRKEYLAQAIASCLRQTAADFEIVVSDDCSSDDLSAVAASFADSRIRYSRSDTRLGATRNHARAVSQCGGQYVIVLNSDDLLLPDCLESAGQALAGSATASAVYFSLTRLCGSDVHGFQPMPRIPFADRRTLRENPWLEKFRGTSPTACLFRRSVFHQVGGYRLSLRLAYDWDLYMRFMTDGGGVVFLPRVLAIYRQHGEQMVQTTSIDGLKDMLILWREPQYAHWPAWEIGEMFLMIARDPTHGWKGVRGLLPDVRSTAFVRLVYGVPQSVAKRLLKRWTASPPVADPNYVEPLDAGHASITAAALVSSLSLPRTAAP